MYHVVKKDFLNKFCVLTVASSLGFLNASFIFRVKSVLIKIVDDISAMYDVLTHNYRGSLSLGRDERTRIFFGSCSVLVLVVRDIFCSRSVLVREKQQNVREKQRKEQCF